MLIGIIAAALASAAPATALDATSLRPGHSCFVIEREGKAIGETWQAIKLARRNDRKVWDVVVHQRVAAAGFDMRDHFVLGYDDLAPLSLDSRRGVKPGSRGWQRVSLRYTPTRILGAKTTGNKTTLIDVQLDHRVVDGNLWGVTFAALPLRQGADFSIPMWQYDNGFGQFTVRVVGSEQRPTPSGPVDAWAIDAGTDPLKLTRYFIAKRDPRELGYAAGPMNQRLGGSCVGLD
ncbi:MAG: hypothetical protein LH465_02665 [Sphingomonas bacterium]|nr:hypothetical protein [Sphingomonas bacterium]